MTLSEYIETEKQALNDFNYYWLEMHTKSPNSYPLELSNLEDFHEQFLFWFTTVTVVTNGE